MTGRAGDVRRLPSVLLLAVGLTLTPVVGPAGAAPGVPAATVRAATADQTPTATGGIRVKLFRVTSKRAGDGGSRAKGALKFRAWNRVGVKGQVNDLCPGDGNWASVWVEPHFRGGREGRPYLVVDKGGCESAPYDFGHEFSTTRAIVRVSVQACVRPAGDQGMPTGHSNCRKENFRNPKVRR